MPTDVADADQVSSLASAAVTRFGRIDVWMNIAGTAAFGRFWEIPVEDQARLVDVNLKGVIYGSHAALNQFVRQGRGTLVNMGSVESVIPLAYHASYAGTKAAILALDRALNQELRHAGRGGTVKVATVMPWAVDTPLWNHAANYTGKAPRVVMLDVPEKVVNALLWASVHPHEELPVGWKARGAVAAHCCSPTLPSAFRQYPARQVRQGRPGSDDAGQSLPAGAGRERHRRRRARAHQGGGCGAPGRAALTQPRAHRPQKR